MKKTIYIHIGTWKTGTTSIQRYFAEHRQKFKAAGLLYPGKDNAHHQFVDDLISWGRKKEKISEYNLSIIEEIVNSEENFILLSSESFHAKNAYNELLSFLSQYLQCEYEVKIIMYLRSQDTIIESFYAQRIFEGYSIDFKTFLEKDLDWTRLDHYHNIIKWAEIFGKENLILRVYDRNRFINGIIPDFLSSIKMENLLKISSPNVIEGISFSPPIVEYLRIFNSICDDIMKLKVRKFFKKSFMNYKSNHSFLSEIDRLLIIKSYQYHNSQIILNRFLPNKKILFSYNELVYGNRVSFEKLSLFHYFKLTLLGLFFIGIRFFQKDITIDSCKKNEISPLEFLSLSIKGFFKLIQDSKRNDSVKWGNNIQPDSCAEIIQQWARTHEPVFIVGHARTGTSIIYRTISESDDFYVNNIAETNAFIFKKRLKDVHNHFDLQDFLGYRGLDIYYCLVKKVFPFGFSDSNYDLLIKIFFYAQYFNGGKKRVVEKTPKHIQKVDEIMRLFPRAKIILCYRNPFSIIASHKRRLKRHLEHGISPDDPQISWLQKDTQFYCDEILESYELIEKWTELYPHNCFIMKYENLIKDKNNLLNNLFSHIGAQYIENLPLNLDKHKKIYWDPLHSPIRNYEENPSDYLKMDEINQIQQFFSSDHSLKLIEKIEKKIESYSYRIN